MRIIGFIAILTLIAMGIYNGGTFSAFIDLGAILIVLGTTIGGFLMSAGPRTGAAFLAAFSKGSSADRLRAGRRAYRSARHGALTGGFFAVTAGARMILKELSDPGSLGPGMALMLLGLFCAVFLAYFILLPLQAGIECRLSEAGEAEDATSETPLDLLVLGGGFLSCAIILVALISAFGK